MATTDAAASSSNASFTPAPGAAPPASPAAGPPWPADSSSLVKNSNKRKLQELDLPIFIPMSVVDRLPVLTDKRLDVPASGGRLHRDRQHGSKNNRRDRQLGVEAAGHVLPLDDLYRGRKHRFRDMHDASLRSFCLMPALSGSVRNEVDTEVRSQCLTAAVAAPSPCPRPQPQPQPQCFEGDEHSSSGLHPSTGHRTTEKGTHSSATSTFLFYVLQQPVLPNLSTTIRYRCLEWV